LVLEAYSVDFSKINIEEILFPEMNGWLLAAQIFSCFSIWELSRLFVYVWLSTAYCAAFFCGIWWNFFTFSRL